MATTRSSIAPANTWPPSEIIFGLTPYPHITGAANKGVAGSLPNIPLGISPAFNPAAQAAGILPGQVSRTAPPTGTDSITVHPGAASKIPGCIISGRHNLPIMHFPFRAALPPSGTLHRSHMLYPFGMGHLPGRERHTFGIRQLEHFIPHRFFISHGSFTLDQRFIPRPHSTARRHFTPHQHFTPHRPFIARRHFIPHLLSAMHNEALAESTLVREEGILAAVGTDERYPGKSVLS